MQHPDELELLAFAEGEGEDLRAHVDSCAECSRAVAQARAGRDALRAAGLVEPPPLEPDWLSRTPVPGTSSVTGSSAPAVAGARRAATTSIGSERRRRKRTHELRAGRGAAADGGPPPFA
jgi:hypothetical protein